MFLPNAASLRFRLGLLSLMLCLGFLPPARAQFLTDGPVLGAVSADSARIYVRTSVARPFTLRLSAGSSVISVVDSTLPELDSSRIVRVGGLAPDTEYAIEVLFNGQVDSITGSLRTFPATGSRQPVTLIAGSCQETANMKTFNVIRSMRPTVFAHLGDYTYPAYQLPDSEYPENYAYLQESYRRRYREVNMREMLREVPISYVYDDDDAVDGGTTRFALVSYRANPATGFPPQVTHTITDSIYPQSQRIQVIRGYTEYFPHYQLVDTSEGIFQSYRMGNVELFHVDVRGCMDSPSNAFEEIPGQPGRFSWNPPANHTLLRQKQFDWLKQGLKNSTADWKVLLTPIPFNRSMKRYLPIALQNQGLNIPNAGTGFRLAYAVAGTWAGYPEQDQLLQYLRDEEIKDVIVVSGDFHANVLDDGTNSGLPEAIGSGLSVVPGDTRVFFGIDAIGQLFGLPAAIDSLWNGGGNGLGANSNNQKNGFAKVDFYGNDSLRMSVVDEDGGVMGSFLLLHSSKVTSRPEVRESLLNIYPNPTTNRVTVRLKEGYSPQSPDRIRLSDASGRFIAQWPLTATEQSLELPQLSTGVYTLSLYTGYGTWVERIQVDR